VLFLSIYPELGVLNFMNITSTNSAILSAIIYNALIIIILIPLSLKGVPYKEISAGKLLKRNILIYGLGGLVAPFIAIKLIDLIITLFGLV
jgi:K+-transporting ATPase ATPase B chain